VFVHGFTGHPKDTWTLKGARQESSDPARKRGQDDEPPAAAHPSKLRKLLSSSQKSTAGEALGKGHAGPESKEPKGVYWPADLAPQTIPNSRILTYGYDTKIRHWVAGPISKNSIYDHAQDFLSTLEHRRRGQNEIRRPILFVAHSLGGIIVKEALQISRGYGSVKPHLHGIFEATIGVLFFGTPHAGADPRNFLHHLLSASAQALGAQVNEKIVSALMPGAEVLARLRDDFSLMCHERKWRIYSFQEEYGVTALFGTQVVDDQSSCLNDLVIETKQRISSNHMDMCRFSGLQDPEYLKVAATLTFILDTLENDPSDVSPDQPFTLQPCPEIHALPEPETLSFRSSVMSKELRETPPQEVEDRGDNPSGRPSRGIPVEIKQSLIDKLYFAKIDERLTSLTAAQGTTCRWFLEKEEYISWRDPAKRSDHGGFIWIKGNPGTGKSTLMKLLFEEAKLGAKNDLLQITLSFFFLARGTDEEKSTVGLYRSLLHQLFEKAEDLKESIEWMTIDGARGIQLNGWHETALKQTLKNSVERLGTRSLTLFVDALDECEDSQARGMIYFFEELCDLAQTLQVQLQICLSSRHYPHIEISKGIEVVLEDEVGHRQDIEQYIRSKLRLRKKTAQALALRSEILNKSFNIFLWVVLVVDILNSEYPDKNIQKMRQRLRDIPQKLADLFEMILARDDENLEELQICLKWVLFANRPLKPQELYFAIQFALDGEDECTGSWDKESVDLDDMKVFARSSSKGLAEVTRNKASEVQFIHESVREFLLGRYGSQWSGSSANVPGHSHELLRDCCSSQVEVVVSRISKTSEAKELRNSISREFPFLTYAVENVLRHANSAQKYDLNQLGFLDSFALPHWITVKNALEKFPVRQYSESINLLYIFAEDNLAELIKICPRKESCFELGSGRYGPPILASIATGSEDALQALSDVELRAQLSESEIQDLLKQYPEKKNKSARIGRDFNFPKTKGVFQYIFENCDEVMAALLVKSGQVQTNSLSGYGESKLTPLSCAAAVGYEALAKLLLDQGASVDFTDIKSCRSPLTWAAENGHEAVARLLLQAGVETEWAAPSDTPLIYAVRNGHEAVVRVLLEHGANVNFRDTTGKTPLGLATKRGRQEVVKLLLDKGARVDLKDCDGQTPLSFAIECGHEPVVREFVARGAIVDLKSNDGQIPLILAIIRGNEEIVKLMLEKGAQVNLNSVMAGKTPLSWAIENGHESVVRLLLDKGAETNLKNDDGRTSWTLAIEGGNQEIAKLLLHPGAQIDIPDNNGRTPLSWAAGCGCESIVRLLLEREAQINLKDNSGRTPLSWAAMKKKEATVRLLLANGADAELVGNTGRTALMFAALFGSTSLISHLLHDDNMESADDSGRTPLSWASGSWANQSVVRLLLERGAVVDSRDITDRTPLSYAAANGNFISVSLLLEKGAAVDSFDNHGQTPLSHAAEGGGVAIVELLLEKGAAVDSFDNHGRTPLSHVAEGEVAIVELLLEKGAAVDSFDNHGRTPLSHAAERGRKGVVQLLLEKGAATDSVDDEGRAPYDWAVSKERHYTAQLLARHLCN